MNTDDASIDLSPPQTRKRSWLRMLGMVLAAIGLLAIAAYYTFQMQAKAALAAEVQRTAGQPLTTDELEQWHRVPAGTKDLTSAWRQALAPCSTREFSQGSRDLPVLGIAKVPPISEPLPEELRAQMEAFIEQHRATLDQIYAVAEQSGEVRFSRNFRRVFDFSDTPQQTRAGLRFLTMEFELLAREPDFEPAFRNLKARLAIAETLANEPDGISMLIRVAIFGVVLSDVQRLAAHHAYTDDELARLQALIRAFDPHPQLALAALGERARIYQIYHTKGRFPGDDEDILAMADKIPSEDIVTSRDLRGIFRPRDAALGLAALNDVYEATQQPLPQAIHAIADIEEEIETFLTAHPFRTRLLYPASRTTAPELVSMLESSMFAEARAVATRNMTLVSLGLRRYRLKHKKLPATLDELVPDFLAAAPTDPYDGQPVRYLPQADSALLYCLGNDLIDNGGETDEHLLKPDLAEKVTWPAE